MRRRSSAGSMSSFSAILSSWISWPKRGCTVPWPRLGSQGASVERAGYAVGAVGAAINQRLQVHRGDGAVLFHAGFEFHQHRVAPAVAIKNFLARQTNFHWAVQQKRGLRDDNFMIEGIALPAKSSAVGRGDHANVRGRHFQHLGQRAVKVMRSLRAGPNGQLSIGIFCSHSRMLLDGKMRAPLLEKRILEDFV